MRKLDRTSSAPPACLARYDHLVHGWDDLGGQCKNELRAALESMQQNPGVPGVGNHGYGPLCAYCEGPIFVDGHIEHFRRKNASHFPELTFAWDNLFLACGSRTHCGHYKDRKGAPVYDPDNLIKPDEDEPDVFLYFHSSGEVRTRSGLPAADATRADETIRVFGLDNRALVGSRLQALSIYKKELLADLDELNSWPAAERQAYFAGEIESTRYEPFATTIRHFLQSYD